LAACIGALIAHGAVELVRMFREKEIVAGGRIAFLAVGALSGSLLSIRDTSEWYRKIVTEGILVGIAAIPIGALVLLASTMGTGDRIPRLESIVEILVYSLFIGAFMLPLKIPCGLLAGTIYCLALKAAGAR
jgi:hypothetical protein